jgi:hypothetical protein
MGGKTRTEKMLVTLPKELAGEVRSIASQGEISSFFTEALELGIVELVVLPSIINEELNNQRINGHRRNFP